MNLALISDMLALARDFARASQAMVAILNPTEPPP